MIEPAPLETVSSFALVEELMSRHDHVVVVMTKEPNPDDGHATLAIHSRGGHAGDIACSMGLVHAARLHLEREFYQCGSG